MCSLSRPCQPQLLGDRHNIQQYVGLALTGNMGSGGPCPSLSGIGVPARAWRGYDVQGPVSVCAFVGVVHAGKHVCLESLAADGGFAASVGLYKLSVVIYHWGELKLTEVGSGLRMIMLACWAGRATCPSAQKCQLWLKCLRTGDAHGSCGSCRLSGWGPR